MIIDMFRLVKLLSSAHPKNSLVSDKQRNVNAEPCNYTCSKIYGLIAYVSG